jgi:hypothetical protein
MLDRHSRLSVPPETAFFDEVAPLLGRRATPAHLARVLERWPRMAELDLGAEAVLERIGQRSVKSGEVLTALLELYARGQGKARCGEKTPRHLMHVPAILEQLPDAKIICMLRDGRETALSLNAMPWWPPNDLAAAARVWSKSARLADRYARSYPRQFEVVCYEDLVTSTQAVLSSVMSYLGEAFEPRQLEPNAPSRVVLSRSLDWKGQALGEVDPAHLGRRHASARPEQLALLERLLGRELRRQGYGEPGALPRRVVAPEGVASNVLRRVLGHAYVRRGVDVLRRMKRQGQGSGRNVVG